MRNLLLFILLLIAIWWVRRAWANLRRNRSAPGSQAKTASPRALGEFEPMLACRQCGVHVPESEGVREGDTFFCCEEHRRAFSRR